MAICGKLDLSFIMIINITNITHTHTHMHTHAYTPEFLILFDAIGSTMVSECAIGNTF